MKMTRERIIKILRMKQNTGLMTVKYVYHPDTKRTRPNTIPQTVGIRLTPQGRVEVVCMQFYGELKTIMLDPEDITEIIFHEACPYSGGVWSSRR